MDIQTAFEQAMALHRDGNLRQAEQLYRQIAQASPMTHGVHFLLGVLQAQESRNTEALASYERALKLKPDFVEALYNHGVVLWQMGRPADALKSYDGVVALLPTHAEAHYNRGVVLAQLSRFEEAVEAYNRALSQAPDFVAALTNRGVAQWILKLHDAALASYDTALSFQSDHVSTHYNRGLVLADMKRWGEALEAYDRSLQLAPGQPDVLSSKGIALMDMGRLDDALAAFDASLTLRPTDPDTLTNRGIVLAGLNRPDEALAAYDKALINRPGFVNAWYNRGMVQMELGLYDAALMSYDQVTTIEPQNADGWFNRGVALNRVHRHEEAVASYNTALAIRPDHTIALTNRGHTTWTHMGLYDAAIWDYERALSLDPDLPNARGELLQIRLYGGDWKNYARDVAEIDRGVRAGQQVIQPFIYQAIARSPADLQKCSAIFANSTYPARGDIAPHPKRGGKKIRIGYVSSDFREQATSYLTAGLYEQHDKDRFEIVAFDNGFDDKSPIRARLEAAFGKFVDITRMNDDAAAEAIRAEEIDILVNLNGYFGQPRMNVFARRPAPVQVNYLGFPATLGADYMDYIIADRTVIPAEERQYYTEQVVWLPDTYQANDDKRGIGPDVTRGEAGLPDDAFVFCNFNQSYKISPDTFASWMKILKATPNSVLWLLATHPVFDGNARKEAERHGVSGERILYAGAMPLAQHLARMKLADLFLDSLPYNAHTTASDSLWAGVPLLTLRGTTFPGRVAASLLGATGLPDLIAETPEAFEKRAIDLAADKAGLKKLRAKLEKDRATCALFDTKRFTRNIEAAYTTMWDAWQKGETPRAFAVEAKA